MIRRPAAALVAASLAATLLAIAFGLLLAWGDAGRARSGSPLEPGGPAPDSERSPRGDRPDRASDPPLPGPRPAPGPARPGPGAGGPGLGSAPRVDPLALAPPASLALEIRLDALRRAPALRPLLARLEGTVKGARHLGGLPLGRCLPRLLSVLDRAVVAMPVGALGGAGLTGGTGSRGAITAGRKPMARGVAGRPKSSEPRPGDGAYLALQGRFDAGAVARCLAGSRPLRAVGGALPAGRSAAGAPGGRWRGHRISGSAGAPARVVAALAPDVLVIAAEGILPGEPAPGVRRALRRLVQSALEGPRPAALGRIGALREGPHTALRLLLPRITIGPVTIPVVPELRALRAVGLHLALPGGGLDLAVVLELPDAAAAGTVRTKLDQAVALASLTVPKALGLSAALDSARVTRKGARVTLRMRLDAAAARTLLAQLGRSLPRI